MSGVATRVSMQACVTVISSFASPAVSVITAVRTSRVWLGLTPMFSDALPRVPLLGLIEHQVSSADTVASQSSWAVKRTVAEPEV